MEQHFEEKYHDVEREHWWFRARRKKLLEMLKDVPRDAKILDVGSSSGLLLQDLREAGFSADKLYGVDISEKAVANCKANGFENAFVMDAAEPGFPPSNFDIIVASDCLEHLEDDRKALKNWYRLLKPQGKLIVFVPAYQFLWSEHDEVNLHFRRYTNKELKEKLISAGYQLRQTGHWNFFLFFPISAYRLAANVFKKKGQKAEGEGEGDLSMPNGLVNATLKNLVYLENKMMSKLRFPFGVSTFCVATKD